MAFLISLHFWGGSTPRQLTLPASLRSAPTSEQDSQHFSAPGKVPGSHLNGFQFTFLSPSRFLRALSLSYLIGIHSVSAMTDWALKQSREIETKRSASQTLGPTVLGIEIEGEGSQELTRESVLGGGVGDDLVGPGRAGKDGGVRHFLHHTFLVLF